jgi:hypothetical protein
MWNVCLFNRLTSRGTVFMQKLIFQSDAQEISWFFETRVFVTVFTTANINPYPKARHTTPYSSTRLMLF